MTMPSGTAASGRRRLIVVGSGIAGLYAALLAADAGADVVLLTKGALADSNTYYAQGGISAVLDEPAPGRHRGGAHRGHAEGRRRALQPGRRPGALHRGAPGHRRAGALRRAL